jgi:hypothetical protein
MLELAQLMRAVEEADLSVFMASIVEVDENVDISAVAVGIEGVILVHGEGVTSFWWLDVECRVVELDVRTEQIDQGGNEVGVSDRAEPLRGVELEVVHSDELRAFLDLRSHVVLAPRTTPAGGTLSPGIDEPVESVSEGSGFTRGEDSGNTQVAVLVVEADLADS